MHADISQVMYCYELYVCQKEFVNSKKIDFASSILSKVIFCDFNPFYYPF
ncbi:protein of unknown function [Ruminococcaceae bacterium BL-6]|nr:protein of unknown function [Ruminococcaceae bacterium BL-6]